MSLEQVDDSREVLEPRLCRGEGLLHARVFGGVLRRQLLDPEHENDERNGARYDPEDERARLVVAVDAAKRERRENGEGDRRATRQR